MEAPRRRASEKKGHACTLVDKSHAGSETCFRGSAADSPQQLGSAQSVEKGVTGVELHNTHGPCIGIGQYGLVAEIGSDLFVLADNRVQGLVPGDAFKLACALGSHPFQGVQDTQR
jgi:hypothetical protein